MLARNEIAVTPSVGSCSERQRLLDLLRGAIDDLGATVRDLRESENGSHSSTASEGNTAVALSACEKIWADLRRHQEIHKCWR